MSGIVKPIFYATDALPTLCAKRKCLNDVYKDTGYCQQHYEEIRRKLRNGSIVDLVRAQRAQERARKNSNYVYFMRCDNGSVKVGRAADVARRYASIRTSGPYDVELITYFEAPEYLEKQIHKALSDYKIRGEWFSPAPPVMKIIETAKNGGFFSIVDHLKVFYGIEPPPHMKAYCME